MARGRVKKWFPDRGTGYLTDAADHTDVFFGDRSLRGLKPEEIKPGLEVEFERQQGDRGPRATNVRRAGASAARESKPSPARQVARPVAAEPVAGLTELAIPRQFQPTVAAVRIEDRHPGLQLDRLVIPGDQERQRAALLDTVRAGGDRVLFADVRQRREAWLKTSHSETWQRTTAGPLTLHLARANALENAGLCLHPVYGFPYLPGSGLKGLARAYATEVACANPADILTVFGNEPGAGEKDGQNAGAVVFHDAWPIAWPELTVDITNNHHPKYYQGEDVPGDWDSPVPVYLLAVGPGARFEFAIAKRQDDIPDRLLPLAKNWLDDALTVSGAGAKTAAGYGSFLAEKPRPAPGPRRAEAVLSLELVTPAFLAAALQNDRDCTLRTATLRGHLRWWWRTLHAGFLTLEELRSLEAAIWGDTAAGSAVRVELMAQRPLRVSLYSHPQERQSGLRYAAYGMDEKSKGVRRQRYILSPGASWELRLTTRKTMYQPPGKEKEAPPPLVLTKEQVLEQVLAAVWLLTQFGGVGSKGRKGFGSLTATGAALPAGLDRCLAAAELLRRNVLGLTREFDVARGDPGSLSDPGRQLLQLSVAATDAFQAMERVGQAYAAVAGQFKHDDGKVAWGLPRKIHGPMGQPLNHQSAATHQPPQWLDFPRRPAGTRPDNARHAAPIHLHLAHGERGTFVVRLLALPARHLPDHAGSVRMLREFAEAFQAELEAGARHRPSPHRPPPTRPHGKQR